MQATTPAVSKAPPSEMFASAPIGKGKNLLWPGREQYNCKLGTVIQTGSGAILAAWYGGNENTGEENQRTSLWLARNDAGNWSAPQAVHVDPLCHVWNPVLFRIDDHRIALYFRKFNPTEQEPQTTKYKERTFQHMVMQSDDDGRSWSAAEPLADKSIGPVKCSMHTLKDGSWLMPTSEKMCVYLQRSTDGGKSWQRVAEVTREAVGESRMTEPCLIPDSKGTFLILLRNRQEKDDARYLMMASYDPATNKVTKAVPTTIPNPDAGVDGLRLADGRMLLIANPSFTERKRLALFMSQDDGRSWNEIREIATSDQEACQPAIMQAKDGSIHILYALWTRSKEKNIVHLALDLKSL